LAIAVVTRYLLHLTWRNTFVIAAYMALYFNVFVLVVQSLKVPPLRAIAPMQKEPPFAVAQSVVLLPFMVLTTFAVKRFRRAR
jgi:hypothetical protein